MPRDTQGNGGIAPNILNLDIRWWWVVSFMPWENRPHYLLDRRLGGLQSWSGHGIKEKNPDRN